MQKTRKFQEDIHEYKYFKGKNGHFWAHTHLVLAEKITNKINAELICVNLTLVTPPFFS